MYLPPAHHGVAVVCHPRDGVEEAVGAVEDGGVVGAGGRGGEVGGQVEQFGVVGVAQVEFPGREEEAHTG